MTTPTIRYETTTCPRCSGTGRHSFNSVHGTVCYGCSGRGKVRTDAGRKASETLAKLAGELASIAVADLQPGDVVRQASRGGRARWSTVTSVEADPLNAGRYTVLTDEVGHAVNHVGTTVLRRRMTPDEFATYVEVARSLKGVTVEEPVDA